MDVATAKLQIRVVLVTYRQHVRRNGHAEAAPFRERALPIIQAIELAQGHDPEVAQLLAEARRELDDLGD